MGDTAVTPSGQPGMWKRQVWVICQGRNLITERTKACILVNVLRLALTTRMPAFLLPQVACFGELSDMVKYKMTGRINVRNAITSARMGFSGNRKDSPINSAILIT